MELELESADDKPKVAGKEPELEPAGNKLGLAYCLVISLGLIISLCLLLLVIRSFSLLEPELLQEPKPFD